MNLNHVETQKNSLFTTTYKCCNSFVATVFREYYTILTWKFGEFGFHFFG